MHTVSHFWYPDHYVRGKKWYPHWTYHPHLLYQSPFLSCAKPVRDKMFWFRYPVQQHHLLPKYKMPSHYHLWFFFKMSCKSVIHKMLVFYLGFNCVFNTSQFFKNEIASLNPWCWANILEKKTMSAYVCVCDVYKRYG